VLSEIFACCFILPPQNCKTLAADDYVDVVVCDRYSAFLRGGTLLMVPDYTPSARTDTGAVELVS
jgi:hypothetical protein